MKHLYLSLIGLLIVGFLTDCRKKDPNAPDCDPGASSAGFNLLSINQDIALGAQVEAEILNNPATYPILDSASNVQAYDYLYNMRDQILNSGRVRNKDRFAWKLRIINDNSTLNAFCTPGGYIYFYTGLIKFLDNPAHLAGVLGHEIAHADLRHSTEALTRQYSIAILLEVIAGNNQGTLTQIATGLLNLSYSRADEKQADEYSVRYLCPTIHTSNGASGFFEKLIATGNNCTSEFFSTHPCPDNRVQEINNLSSCLSCSSNLSPDIVAYNQFKAQLP